MAAIVRAQPPPYTILYYTILYYTILYYTILYYTSEIVKNSSNLKKARAPSRMNAKK